jgi:GT2 family glycosyltransferase
MTRVRACIVAYRSGRRAVAAVQSAIRAGAEVSIVNNSPGDGLGDLVNGADFIQPIENLGFAAGSNLAAEGAETDYLLFLNPDATIDRDGLEALVAYLDGHPEAAVAGPALRDLEGRPQPSVRLDPTAGAVLHQYTAFRFLLLFRRGYRRYRRPPQTPGPVPVLMGSVLLVRRGVFEALGGFDERYFMYYEEADLCRRVRETGHQVVFVTEANATHEGGASAAFARTRLAAERLISAQRYLGKFLPPGRFALFRVAFWIGFPIATMLWLLRDLVMAKTGEAASHIRLLTRDFFRVLAA